MLSKKNKEIPLSTYLHMFKSKRDLGRPKDILGIPHVTDRLSTYSIYSNICHATRQLNEFSKEDSNYKDVYRPLSVTIHILKKII